MSVEADYPTISGPEAGRQASGGFSCPLGGTLQLEFFEGESFLTEAEEVARWHPCRIQTVWARPEFL